MSATVTDVIPEGWEVRDTPAGHKIFYRDSDHSYWSEVSEKKPGKWTGVRAARLAGISTVIAPYAGDPDPLLRWAARLTREGVAALAAEGMGLDDLDDMRAALSWLQSADSIGHALTDATLSHDQERDRRAIQGTNVHKLSLEEMASGAVVPDYAAMTTEEKAYSEGIEDFWIENDPDPEHSETMVTDPDLRVCGRLDLIATLRRGKYAGMRAQIDGKTSGFIPAKHHVQVAGYKHCAEVSGYGETDAEFILKITPEGKYRLIPVHATADSFRLAVGVYRDMGRIDRLAGADARAAA